MPRTHIELQNATDAILYELQMLEGAFDLAIKAADGISKNCFVEAYATHCRTLIEFLLREKTNPDPDDIKVRDFLVPTNMNEWEQIRRNEEQFQNEVWKKANKRLSHLTFTNLNWPDENKSWPAEYGIRIINLVLKFRQLVEQEYLSEGFLRWQPAVFGPCATAL